MRKLKFRCWDNVTKTMIYNSPTMVIRLSGKVTDGSTTPDVVLMQYTGLEDANGKEIYEGDVVICLSEKSYCGKIGEKCAVEFNNEWACFAPFSYYDSEWNVYNYPEYFEVIGNIYENPELIKETK